MKSKINLLILCIAFLLSQNLLSQTSRFNKFEEKHKSYLKQYTVLSQSDEGKLKKHLIEGNLSQIETFFKQRKLNPDKVIFKMKDARTSECTGSDRGYTSYGRTYTAYHTTRYFTPVLFTIDKVREPNRLKVIKKLFDLGAYMYHHFKTEYKTSNVCEQTRQGAITISPTDLSEGASAFYHESYNDHPDVKNLLNSIKKEEKNFSNEMNFLSNQRIINKVTETNAITGKMFRDIIKQRDTILISELIRKFPTLMIEDVIRSALDTEDSNKIKFILSKFNYEYLPERFVITHKYSDDNIRYEYEEYTKFGQKPPTTRLLSNININNKNITLNDKFEKEKNNTIQSKLSKLTKGKFEKEADYKKRYENEKRLLEAQYSTKSYEKDNIQDRIKVKSYRFDSESRILMLDFEQNNSVYIEFPDEQTDKRNDKARDFEKKFNQRNAYYLDNLELDILEDGIVLKKGDFKDKINNKTYSFTNIKPTNFNIKKTDKEALKIYNHKKKRPILAEIAFYNTSNKGNLFIFSDDNLFNDYISYINEKRLRYKRETEVKEDYRTIKSYKHQTSFGKDTIKGNRLPDAKDLFKKYEPNYNFYNVKSIEYDSESEIFKLTYSKYGVVFVPVPITEAEKFENYLKTNSFREITYNFRFIERNELMLDGLRFSTNDNKIYTFSDGSTRNLKITYDAISPSQYHWVYKDKIVKYLNESLFDNIKQTYNKEVINTQKYINNADKVFIQLEKNKVEVRKVKEEKTLKSSEQNIKTNTSNKYSVNNSFNINGSYYSERLSQTFRVKKIGNSVWYHPNSSNGKVYLTEIRTNIYKRTDGKSKLIIYFYKDKMIVDYKGSLGKRTYIKR
jgi:hypothetical protein